MIALITDFGYTDRKGIIAVDGRYVYVLPDNGIISAVASGAAINRGSLSETYGIAVEDTLIIKNIS